MTVKITRSIAKAIVLLFLLLFASNLLTLSDAAEGAKFEYVNGFHLRQLSEDLGPIDAFISGDFCRFDNNANATSCIINSKTNEITILNHKRKLYWTTPVQRFSPALAYVNKMERYSDYGDLKPVGSKTKTMLSLPITVEILKNPEKFTGTAVKKWDKLVVVSAEIAGCPSISQNKNMTRFASRFFSMPESHAYPLEFTYTNRKGGVHTILKTFIAEKVKMRKEKFRSPLDYKMAKSQPEVYLDSTGRDTLEDMLK